MLRQKGIVFETYICKKERSLVQPDPLASPAAAAHRQGEEEEEPLRPQQLPHQLPRRVGGTVLYHSLYKRCTGEEKEKKNFVGNSSHQAAKNFFPFPHFRT